MDKDRVAYMLSLGKKKRDDHITSAELIELDDLRKEYLADFREGFRQQLDNVYVQQEDGTHKKLEKKSSADNQEGET
ncbi:MAG: DUF896 domain-containing protein [Clostridiales bacterium]|nr:DUF896 domain-containing protein [Clostridiales bacterium]